MNIANYEEVKCKLLHFLSTKNRREVVKLSPTIYIYKGFRFTFLKESLDVRYVKYDKEEFFKVYEYGKSRTTKSYFYKTVLLIHQEVDTFCKLSVNEFENRG